jgi:cytochrome c biogenesis factor
VYTNIFFNFFFFLKLVLLHYYYLVFILLVLKRYIIAVFYLVLVNYTYTYTSLIGLDNSLSIKHPIILTVFFFISVVCYYNHILTGIIAIILGSWWASQEYNWGGFWSFDFIENSILIYYIFYIYIYHKFFKCFLRCRDVFFREKFFFFFFFFLKFSNINSIHSFVQQNIYIVIYMYSYLYMYFEKQNKTYGGVIFSILIYIMFFKKILAIIFLIKILVIYTLVPTFSKKKKTHTIYKNLLTVLLLNFLFFYKNLYTYSITTNKYLHIITKNSLFFFFKKNYYNIFFDLFFFKKPQVIFFYNKFSFFF